jgi:hypothetical protein
MATGLSSRRDTRAGADVVFLHHGFLMPPLQILVAGPYRSGTNDDPALIARNVHAMTDASLQLIEHGGSTGIGDAVFTEIFHPISRRLVAKCDGCLRIGGASVGADEMVALARSYGRAVYFSLSEIPPA